MIIDNNNDKIFVSNYDSNTVSVINGSTFKIISSIIVDKGPAALELDSARNLLFVANFNGKSISVINSTTNKLINSVDVSVTTDKGRYYSSPTDLAYDSAKKQLYVGVVVNNTDGRVKIYELSSLHIMNDTKKDITMSKPVAITYNPFNKAIYVAHTPNNISILQGDAIVKKLSVNGTPNRLVADPENGDVYATTRTTNHLYFIDSNSLTVDQNYTKLDANPLGIALNTRNNRLYITHITENSPEKEEHSIDIVNIKDRDLLKDDRIHDLLKDDRPEPITVDSSRNFLFLGMPDDDNIRVLEGEVHEFSQPILFGSIVMMTLILFGVSIWRIILHRSSNVPSWFTYVLLIGLPIAMGFFNFFYQWEIKVIRGYQLDIRIEGFFWVSILITILVVIAFYPPFPFPISMTKYFKKRGYAKAVNDYDRIKKILYATVPFLIMVTIVNYLPEVRTGFYNLVQIPIPLELQLINGSLIEPTISIEQLIVGRILIDFQIILLLIVIAGFIKVIFLFYISKDFRYCYTKGNFEKSKYHELESTKKIHYVIKGLDSYFAYLHNYLGLRIKSVTKIYSIIIKNYQDMSIYDCFDNNSEYEKTEPNTLEPLQKLQTYLYKHDSTMSSLDDILTKRPLEAKDIIFNLKEYLAVATTIVSIIGTIIAFY
ncbi:MAG: hypothetical protein ACRD8W_20435 [Nitrososphaeraceae archaeon]